MATTQLPSGNSSAVAGDVLPRPRYRVSVKKKWSDSWSTADTRYIQPTQATIAAAPRKSSARFVYHFGRIKREDKTQSAVEKLRDFRDRFIRIELVGYSGSENSDLWVGRIGANDQSHDGITANTAGSVATGVEVYDAFGLEHELDRSPIRGAFISNDEPGLTKATFIDTPLKFNEKFDLGHNVVGNRSLEKATLGEALNRPSVSYIFAGAKGKTKPWSVGDIVQYLLTYHAPAEFGFTLAGSDSTLKALEKIVLPRVDLNGRTVFQALDYLIDRKRGLGWCLRLSGDQPTVHVYSVLDEPVKFDDATIPANPDQRELRLDDLGHLVDGAAGLQYDVLGRYGRIIVSGARVLTCFSLSEKDETLQPGWTDAEATAYKNGAGLTTETGAAGLNDTARAVDHLAHVWTHYHVPKVFNWKAGNGEGKNKTNANPKVSNTGKMVVEDPGQPPIRNWGHRFERLLPLRRSDQKTDTEPEFMAPFAVVYDERVGKWVFADHNPGKRADVRMLDTTLGVEVRFHPAHVLARGVSGNDPWAGAKPSGFDPNTTDQGNKEWGFIHAKMILTVAIRTDKRLEVVIDIDKEGPLKDRVLQLEVPDAELWYILPNTVVGIDATTGALQRAAPVEDLLEEMVILRDDGERLRTIAALAKSWYRKERASLGLTVKDLWLGYEVGSLIRSVDDRLTTKPVNTPVSQVTWDFIAATTTIRTSWSELDVTAGRSAGRKRTG